MLDDLNLIRKCDAQDALGIAAAQWQQLAHEFDIPKLNLSEDNIVYAGMGGSALAGMASVSWPGYGLPFEVVRGYTVPAYVSSKTFFIASSYSGNTEETLSALAAAEERGARIAVIASGGKLLESAQSKSYPLAVIPKVSQPRYAVLYNIKALVTLLERAGVVASEQAEHNLKQAAEFLQKAIEQWLPNVPTARNRAKQIAQELMGKSVVVYAGPRLFPAAYKWKINMNENAKHIAWCNQYSELNHNEMLGWTKQPVDKPYAVIELRSNLEHPRIQKRFEVTERLLSGLRPEPIVVEVQGETILQQLLWAIALGDFVSLYLAILSDINPTPVNLIEKFKLELDR